MIAADSSSIINFLQGADTADRILVRRALQTQDLWLPPPVKTELLSARPPHPALEPFLREAPVLAITDGFWERAGDNRRLILSKWLKARLADTLIAQCCIDAGATLIARDDDYRHFAQWCGLTLAT